MILMILVWRTDSDQVETVEPMTFHQGSWVVEGGEGSWNERLRVGSAVFIREAVVGSSYEHSTEYCVWRNERIVPLPMPQSASPQRERRERGQQRR